MVNTEESASHHSIKQIQNELCEAAVVWVLCVCALHDVFEQQHDAGQSLHWPDQQLLQGLTTALRLTLAHLEKETHRVSSKQ